ncbi:MULTISPECIES: Rpn family recombination-promoting nuclease/putative transposase [unclassified Oceanispirochaeta]|uniref:Rpn family recombination-promoting nuclease/putative transposase n=1 Tax=unclassified Oceanispirochaeta TaxID=2635722 RepID=UPI001314D1A1|nr:MULTISPECIES: Rpn family recombination-promoting nuclease/putative transposase [unclassified Oceanispirochaeta]MBF9018905.1 PD-(D/E)XK nuclease family transposase [Oceanispirochaeta sp. M2]NPD75404.1 PD-(D/E)XK nuclease family transposase [Oceanispirochaeta sp. M1]
MKHMATWIKATSDIMIRVLLGQEENILVLKDFINSVLEDRGFPPVVNLIIKNPVNMRDVFNGKETFLDVKAKDETGRTFDIEIQSSGGHAFVNRSLYYWAKLYNSQIEEGHKFKKLNPVICINILNFELFKDNEERNIHSCFMIQDLDNPDNILSDHLQIHFLELPRMIIDRDHVPSMRLQKWMWYLKEEGNLEENDMNIILKDDPVFEKAHNTFRKFTADEMLREKYEARMKWESDRASAIGDAWDDGIEQGREQGRTEEKKILSREYADKLKKSGVAMDIIISVTGLSKEEIKSI